MRKYERNYLRQINIDKLKICYRQPDELWNEIYNKYEENAYIKKYEYEMLLRVKEEDMMQLQIYTDNTFIGTLTLNNSNKYKGLCFFTFDNRNLYCDWTECYDIGKHNYIFLWDEIADDLGLEYNSLTEVEVAFDTTSNIISKTLKLIKNFEYEMYVNGKKVDDKKIENYFECYSRTRTKKDKHPTLYFAMKKDGAPKMRIYNKTEEIKDNNNRKEYINYWNGFGKKTTYRCEVVIKSNYFKEYCEKNNIDMYFSSILQDEDMLIALWYDFVYRLVHFKDKQGNEVSIIDLI